jgi:hypothetical protein
MIIEHAKTYARHRRSEDHQDLEVVPDKNLEIENSHAKEAHARGDQNQKSSFLMPQYLACPFRTQIFSSSSQL